jgi:hypothetical protein
MAYPQSTLEEIVDSERAMVLVHDGAARYGFMRLPAQPAGPRATRPAPTEGGFFITTKPARSR